jgi:surface polysaccharide O-acyltransferase-like enzyme
MKIKLGYIFLGISALLYIGLFAIPFIDLFSINKLLTGTIFYVMSYLFMFLGFWFLGKDLARKIKDKFLNIFRKNKS